AGLEVDERPQGTDRPPAVVLPPPSGQPAREALLEDDGRAAGRANPIDRRTSGVEAAVELNVDRVVRRTVRQRLAAHPQPVAAARKRLKGHLEVPAGQGRGGRQLWLARVRVLEPTPAGRRRIRR